MRTSRRVLKTKTFHPVPEFTKGRRGGSAGKPAADDYDLKLSPVVWADQSRMVLMISPFLIQRPRRNLRIQCSNYAVKCLKPCRNVIPIEATLQRSGRGLRGQAFHLDPNQERFINRNIQRCFASLNMTASGMTKYPNLGYCLPPHLSFLNDTRPDPSSKASKCSGFCR